MRYIGLLAAVAAAATTSVIIANSFLCGDVPTGTGELRTFNLLSSITIPNIRLEEVTLEDAVSRLNKYAADAGINFGKPMFVLWKETDPTPENFRRFSPQEQAYMRAKYGLQTISERSTNASAQDAPAHSKATPARISFSIDSCSLYEVSRFVADKANHCLEVDDKDKRILIIPEFELCPPLVTKEYYFDNDPLPLLGLPRAKPTRTQIDLRSVLEPNGVHFLPSSFAYYEPKQRKIVVRGQRDDVDLVYTLFSPTPMYNSPCERRRSHLEDLWWQATRHLPSFCRPSFPPP